MKTSKVAHLGLYSFLCILLFASFAHAYTGSGTEEYPYLITSAADMNEIGLNSGHWGSYFLLTADIDLGSFTGTQFNIIGNSSTEFTGTFDGNDQTISNFTYICPDIDAQYIGIFGDARYATIKNLGLIDPNIDTGTSYEDGGVWVGPLAGNIDFGTITGCYTEGGSIAGGRFVGGLVGESYGGLITDCRAAVTVSGWGYIGGLVGESHRGLITDCHTAATVAGWGCIGGLVGFTRAHISNCHTTGTTIGLSGTGGLVGWNWGQIYDCYATGDVRSNFSTGGLVGTQYTDENSEIPPYAATIDNCYASGAVSGDEDVGGLVGRNGSPFSTSVPSFITNCYSSGNVTSDRNDGGLVGFNRHVLSNCYAIGTVDGNDANNTGGLVGFDDSGSYTKCFWDSDINPDMNGIGNATDPNVIGESTANMKIQSTFTNWDFVGETINGPNDFWDICEGVTYPRLGLLGDFAEPNGVNFIDFAFFAEHWQETDCNGANIFCDHTDLDRLGTVDFNDLYIFIEKWLIGKD